MTESWRRKTYYNKRVLVETSRVLNPQFSDTLICLTGAELEILRNLTQYVHRRSTFASGYTKDYYLAPTNDEWDVLSAIVADLEEKLMGCDDILALLESILVQVTCVCEGTNALLTDTTSVPDYGPGTRIAIDNYLIVDGLQVEDDYGDDTTASNDRCAVAQLTFWNAWEFTTEVLQPALAESVDILLPAAMAALALACGTVALLIPVGVILAVLWKLIEVFVEGDLVDVQNAIWANRDELTCAVWDGLHVDYREAESRARDVIDDIDGLSYLDKALLKLLFAPWAIGAMAKAWTNQTAWALSQVESGACDDCEWTRIHIWNMPPCPALWAGTFECTIDGRLGIRDDTHAYSEEFSIESVSQPVDVQVFSTWSSAHPSGWTVGYLWIQYEDALDVWQNLGAVTCTNTTSAGGLNSVEGQLEDITIPRNVLRVRLAGQAGQHGTNPWPLETAYIKLVFSEHS